MKTPQVEALPGMTPLGIKRSENLTVTGRSLATESQPRTLLNIDTAKSYATEENLTRALRKLGLDEFRPLVVRNRSGRYTAVFAVSFLPNGVSGGAHVARLGFMAMG